MKIKFNETNAPLERIRQLTDIYVGDKGGNMKTCTKCGIEKELTEFSKLKNGKLGVQAKCKSCDSIYYEKNKERQSIRMKKYREDNKEKRKEYLVEYYKKGEAKNMHRAYRNKWESEKYKKEGDFKVKQNMRRAFCRKMQLYSESGNKTKSFLKYTGLHYSEYIEYFKTTQPEEFNLYLEKGKYHIDHIIPCALYDFNDPEEIKKCWHPHNLRIIPAEENLNKSNKLDLQLVDKYNIRHLLPKGGFNED